MNLQGKTVLITGAARRIGRAISLSLAKKGAHLVLHCHKSKEDLRTLKREIEALGARAYWVSADLSSSMTISMVNKLLSDIYRQTPQIDVLINNASAYYPTKLAGMNDKNWQQLITLNLKAPFFLANEIGKRMLKRKLGKIINLVDANVGRPHPFSFKAAS